MTSDTLLPYVVPREPGRAKAIALAVLVHALLFAFLWVGINWVSQPPESLEVDTFTQAELDQTPPEPPQPIPTPEVKDKAPVDNDAEIRIAQQKKKEEEDAAKLAAQKKAEEKQKADEEKRQKEQDEADKKREEQAKKDLEKKQAQKDKDLADKLHKEDIARLKNEAGGSSALAPARVGGGKGDSAWAGKVEAKVKSLIAFNPGPNANPNTTVEFDVQLLPDGSVGSVRKTKPSGIPAFDDAVERAIRDAAPYPHDNTGIVPPRFSSSHRLGELQ